MYRMLWPVLYSSLRSWKLCPVTIVVPGSRIRLFFIPNPGSRVDNIPDPGSGSASKNFNIFNQKSWYPYLVLKNKILDVHIGSRIPDHGSGFFSIPDQIRIQGSKKHRLRDLDLQHCLWHNLSFTLFCKLRSASCHRYYEPSIPILVSFTSCCRTMCGKPFPWIKDFVRKVFFSLTTPLFVNLRCVEEGAWKGEGEGSRFVCHFSKGLLFTDVLPVLVPFYGHHATICTLKSLYLPYIYGTNIYFKCMFVNST